jgi:hypothetical protein
MLALGAGVDRLAMWLEDHVAHVPEPYRACVPRPLACFEPLTSIPAGPVGPGLWSAPSPRQLRGGDRMTLHAIAARAPFRGTAILVPPWKTESPSLVRRYTDLLAGRGYDVWFVVPPEHMERAVPGARSGHGFATLDLERFRALFEQLVLEIRAAVAMARRRGPAGIVGLSIGGLAAALATTAPDAPEFSALVAPPADLAAVLSATPIGRRYRRLAELAGSRFPEPDELRRALACFDPRGRAPAAGRVFLAIGRYDRIALDAGGRALAAAWRVAPALYARGHLTLLFCCRALLRDLGRFVDGVARTTAAAG